MSHGHTVILIGDTQRSYAKRLIDAAPDRGVVTIKEAKRTTDQNALMWALLSELSIQMIKMGKRVETPDGWKLLMMKLLGHEIMFMEGLDGRPFPVGLKSSKLSVSEMRDLIEVIYQYGAENGVVFMEKRKTD